MLNGHTAAYDCAKLKGVDVMVIGRNGLRSFYMLPALIQFLAQAVLISNHNAHSWVSQRLIEIGQLTIISISHVWILLLNTIPTLNGVNSEMCIRLKISTLAHWHTTNDYWFILLTISSLVRSLRLAKSAHYHTTDNYWFILLTIFSLVRSFRLADSAPSYGYGRCVLLLWC